MSAPVTAILLHSFGSAGRSWSEVQDRLGTASLAPDLPGFGAEAPLASPSVEAYAGWVLARLEDLQTDAVLVGASMGGKVAMAVAARRPANLRGMVLCAPSPPTAEPITQEERDRQLHAWGDEDAARDSVAGSTLAAADSGRFQHAVEDWLRTSQAAWRWWWEAGSREVVDVSPVDVPVVILAGSHDDHLGAEVQRRETAPRLPGATVEQVSASGHLLALDRPDAVAQAIADVRRRR